MLRLLTAAALALIASRAHGADVTIQEVLLRAKPAVVMVVSEVAVEVTLSCTSGDVKFTPDPLREMSTGWFVAPSGWVVTNAHVVSAAHRPPEALLAEQGQKALRPGCRLGGVKAEPSILVILSNGLRLSATIAKYSPPLIGEAMSGQDLALLKLEAADMPSLSLGDSSAAKIGDGVHILGFPGVVVSHELLNASAKVEASVTHGAVSGFKQDKAGQPVVQTDAAAAWGNSGGPAVDDEGRVAGVLTLPAASSPEQAAAVQGFNFVIPAETVRGFLKDTPVKLDERSSFNTAWTTALRAFFAGNHPQAEKAFAEANRLLPELPDLKRLRAENTERIKNPPPRPFPWVPVVGAGIAVALVAAAGFLGHRWRRNRFRVKPAEVARWLESGEQPPVILDVRDTTTYTRSPVRIPNSLHIAPDNLRAGVSDHRIEPERTVVAYCT